MSRLGLNILILLITNSIYSQWLYNRYVNIKLGEGVSFAGRGIMTEYRTKHWSIYASAGFMPEQVMYEKIVPSSYNFGGALRYYYYRKSGYWQFFVSAHSGWLNNYYHPEIGNKPYKYNVYGIVPLVGVEIREELLNFELNIIVDPGQFTFNSNNYPYYNKYWYVSIGAGIGINLFALNTKINLNRKKKKNLVPSNDINIIDTVITPVYNKKQQEDVIINASAKELINECNQNTLIQEKAFLYYDTLFLIKQVASSDFILVKQLMVNKENYFYTSSLSNNNSLLSVYLIRDKISLSTPEDFVDELTELRQIYIAKDGIFKFYLQDNECFAKLENINFDYKGQQLYFDQIKFCKVEIKQK